MADLFWLSDEQWAVLAPFMPRNRPGARRVDDRRVLSGIVHVLTSGCRWRDCPAAYGPRTTVYNRFNRWSRRGFWRAMLAALAAAGWVVETAALDSTDVRAHRSAHGAKGGTRTGATMPTTSAASCEVAAPRRSSPAAATASGPFALTSGAIASAGARRLRSAASRTSAAWQRAMTHWPAITPRLLPSPPSSRSGAD